MPEQSLLILAILLDTARFENQRWIKARIGGLKGTAAWVGVLVDMTGFLGMLFYYLFLAAYGYDTSPKDALILYGILVVIGIIIGTVLMRLFRDSKLAWLIGTLAIWPLAVLLSAKVTWFGTHAIRF